MEEKKRQRTIRRQREPGQKKRRALPRLGRYGVPGVLFLALLLLLCAGNILHKDQTYSEQENRVLAGRPELSLSELASGRFMEQYEEYQADQMAGRNLWVKVKTLVDSLAGKKEENGVFNGKDSYLLEDIAVPDEAELETNLSAIRQFAQAYPETDMHMLLVPNAANILKKKLPLLAVTADQSQLIEDVKDELGKEVQWIDAEAVLRENQDASVYYRTDHHWTTLGAYEVFLAAKDQLGLGDRETVKMKAYGVSNTFNGTLSAVSGYQLGYKEAIFVYLPEGEDVPQIVVNYVEEQEKTASLYDSEKLKERDQYAMFLGGNHALIDIKAAREDGERLLVIKDSYANCFIPFLTPYYREIVVVDPRYYTGDLSQIMEENRIDRVLFLYNANTFFEDRMLGGVLESALAQEDTAAFDGQTEKPQDSAGEDDSGQDAEPQDGADEDEGGQDAEPQGDADEGDGGETTDGAEE